MSISLCLHGPSTRTPPHFSSHLVAQHDDSLYYYDTSVMWHNVGGRSISIELLDIRLCGAGMPCLRATQVQGLRLPLCWSQSVRIFHGA